MPVYITHRPGTLETNAVGNAVHYTISNIIFIS